MNRIVLGIRQIQPGGQAFEISPWIGDLTSASGAMATPKGPVHVDWKINGETLTVNIAAPKGVKIDFKPNASHQGLEVIVEKI